MLIELLAACFCLGIVGLLVTQLIVPSLLAALKILNQEGDRTPRALAMIRRDVAGSLAPGVSLAHQGQAWWLAIVRLDQPGTQAQRIWSRDLILYRYQKSTLSRQLLSDLKWPDGSPRLTGSEPVPFQLEELMGLPEHQQQVLASSLQAEAWTSLTQPWTVTFRAQNGGKRSCSLCLGDLL